MAVSVKIAVFWVVVLYRLVKFTSKLTPVYMVPCSLAVNLYQSTQCYNPEDSHLPTNLSL
jgi:hypothetical protein